MSSSVPTTRSLQKETKLQDNGLFLMQINLLVDSNLYTEPQLQGSQGNVVFSFLASVVQGSTLEVVINTGWKFVSTTYDDNMMV